MTPSELPHFEFSRADFVANMETILRDIVPQRFSIGSEDEAGDIRFRMFSLPDNPQEREKRVEEIRQRGSDRTDPLFIGRHDSLYERAAEIAGIQAIDVMDTMTAVDIRRQSRALLQPPEGTYLGANGILIYDATTDKGIVYIDATGEFTFRDLRNRSKALLAIVGLR